VKVVLRDLPNTAIGEYYAFESVVQTRHSCAVHLLTHPSGRRIEIVFKGIVGLKVLDERDFGQFWRLNLDPPDATFTGTVKQVLSGGWLQEEEIQSSHVPSGFYGDVVEFLVTTDYQCVNVLCTGYPEMRVTAASALQE